MLLSELIGQKGIYNFLKEIYSKKDLIKVTEVNDLLEENKITDNLFSLLIKNGLIRERLDGYYITSLGSKTVQLLQVINEEMSLFEAFNKLKQLYPSISPYELITEKITDYFIDNLYSAPSFIRLYICSPWIKLEMEHFKKIKNAIIAASADYEKLQIFVITLPLEQYRDRKAFDSVRELINLGAEVVTNTKLHAKLYISEPGPKGGSHYAIIGSENLTGRGNIELAIKIRNDNEILNKLNLYFREIFYNSKFLQEGNNEK